MNKMVRLEELGTRHEPWHAPDDDGAGEADRREAAIQRRVQEIWDHAGLLRDALSDACLPFDLGTATQLRDAAWRLDTQSRATDSDSDKCLRGIVRCLEAAVIETAVRDIDDSIADWDGD